MNPQAQRRMTFSGDYGMDKWVSYKEGSVSVSGFSSQTAAPTHNLGAIPLIYTQWSETSDFGTPLEVAQAPNDLYPLSEPWVTRTWADATTLNFQFLNQGSASKTVYYRMWALPTHNWSNSVESTSTISGLSPFTFNGEQNYLKLFQAGRIVVSTPTSIAHNLGYLPTTMVWEEGGMLGGIAPVFQPIGYIDPMLSAEGIPLSPGVTNNTIEFPSSGTFHYRIYLEPIYE